MDRFGSDQSLLRHKPLQRLQTRFTYVYVSSVALLLSAVVEFRCQRLHQPAQCSSLRAKCNVMQLRGMAACGEFGLREGVDSAAEAHRAHTYVDAVNTVDVLCATNAMRRNKSATTCVPVAPLHPSWGQELLTQLMHCKAPGLALLSKG